MIEDSMKTDEETDFEDEMPFEEDGMDDGSDYNEVVNMY